MSKTTVDKGGVVTVTEYEYDDSGTRVSQTVTADGTTTVTEYLYDSQNHTGFAQILEEVVDAVLTKAFTLGHDVITQATTSQVLHLLYDGHGSTRVVTDVLAAVLERYTYDAYGNALGFDTANALTTLLHSGEITDATTGLQYLRARYYDSASGRFARLDPFAGNINDPQSLHKYLYVHGDPINGIDPAGLTRTLISLKTAIVISGIIAGAATVDFIRNPSSFFNSLLVPIPVDIGRVEVHYHAVRITGASKSADELFSALAQFAKRDLGAVSADRNISQAGLT